MEQADERLSGALETLQRIRSDVDEQILNSGHDWIVCNADMLRSALDFVDAALRGQDPSDDLIDHTVFTLWVHHRG